MKASMQGIVSCRVKYVDRKPTRAADFKLPPGNSRIVMDGS